MPPGQPLAGSDYGSGVSEGYVVCHRGAYIEMLIGSVIGLITEPVVITQAVAALGGVRFPR